MKTHQFVLFTLAVFCLGCQSHFYKVKEDTLYFYLNRPEAQNVQLRCSFDGFKAHPAKKTDNELWEVAVPYTSEFIYFYIVDDAVFLPPCRLKEKDDFGTENCIFIPDL